MCETYSILGVRVGLHRIHGPLLTVLQPEVLADLYDALGGVHDHGNQRSSVDSVNRRLYPGIYR